ncbi:tyrosine protein phosphatase [Domibacillus sp. PGB-M46]|uniref:tyrosine-protein phosphatase n=1 Tax=Domibacillus sp. PGB-M46 TaxID=2910255 RepID=UPI001F5A24B0|nr:CpsB/CapC family capsule biosynthesis tyrosine phosphatase [Domibacillus sp. PGB-M46]MCI2253115.1 tyrosine protein phosphatase [Domibacillus sp. PGB-M46]
MIDLHCHILPGFDDGASELTKSLEMAQAAQEEGIIAIVATPHHQNGKYHNERSAIEPAVADLNKQIQQMGLDITIYPGQEVRLYGELLEDYQNDRLVPVNHSAHMLIEFPSSSIPAFTEQLLFDMQLKGITPIIVHPERNAAISEDPNKLYKLIKNGALSQVTAASVNGQFGKKVKALSMQLIEANLTHFVASDAHNTTSRGFGLVQAYNAIDPDYAAYFQENAEAVLSGRYIEKEPPHHVARKKKFLGLF